MRWLRRDPADLEGVEDVAQSLEAAAADAPPSPRLLEIRTAVLEETAALHQPALAMRAVVLAAVILLAVAVAIGAPAVGSIVDELIEDATPAPVLPEPDARIHQSEDLTKEDPKRMVQRDAIVVPRNAVETDAPASEAPSATPSVVPSTTPSPVPSATPDQTDPPISVPTPPVRIPTPPVPIPTPIIPVP